MSNVFYRHTAMTPPEAIDGDGPYILDQCGNRFLDCGDAAVSCLGHSHPGVTQAIKDQLDHIAFAHSGFFTNPQAETLATMLSESTPTPMSHVYLVSGGSEAVESALKMARQYFVEINQPQRRHIIARKQSYHGNTLGALAAGGNEWRRAQFSPLLIDSTHHIAPCYPYRDQADGETPEAYGLRIANELEDKILALGADDVMAFIAEPVVGATSGALTPVPGYFERIREICDQYGVLLILDEVMCGMGRTGSLFAYEQENIRADLVTIAKGLGAGYQPIGATIVSEHIYNAIAKGTGFFQHGHTYMGHPTACAAAVAVQTAFRDQNLLANVKLRGEQLMAELKSRFDNHPHVGDIRGRGLFLGLELVKDRESKTPFDPALKLNALIKKVAFNQNHFICYPMGGTIDGKLGDHVLLTPPFIINENHIAEIVDKLESSINTAIKGLND